MTRTQLNAIVTQEARAYRAYRDAAQKGAADKEWAGWMTVNALSAALEATMTQKERDLFDEYRKSAGFAFGID
jgi:hypothetical protein